MIYNLWKKLQKDPSKDFNWIKKEKKKEKKLQLIATSNTFEILNYIDSQNVLYDYKKLIDITNWEFRDFNKI